MKPNVARAGMARLGASVLTILALASPAWAGDRALIDIIGYSENGQYFAFEEFGIQDGSGFAYSSIYIIDLSTDSWVVGTPLREQADDEGVSLSQIRAEVQLQAAPDIEGFGIEVPAEYAALIGDGAPDSDGQTLRFGSPGYEPGDVSGDYELRLSTFPTTAVAPCAEWFSVDPMGYQLVISDKGSERLIHRDGALPRSRGCPVTYRLHGVVLPFNAGSISQAVALISVYPGGFEGPDRRFIAVPLGL
jgi:predicted secreted protein